MVAKKRSKRALDQTQQFFAAGEVMEVAGDFGDTDAGRYIDAPATLVRRWLALAAASALALLMVVLAVG